MCIPPHTTIPPGRMALRAAGTSRANRSKDHHRIQWFRRWHVGTAGPDRAHFECEILCSGIAWGGEREQFPSLVTQDLSHDVGSSAKTINANLFGVAGHLQCAITDQSGAQ